MNETWNEKRINTLIKWTKEELSKQKLSFFQTQFLKNQLQELKDLKYNKSEKKVTYLDKDKILRKDVYQDYKRIPSWLKEQVLNSIFLYEEYEKDIFYEDLPHCKINRTELLQHSYDYIKWFQYPSLLNFFQRYFLESRDFLQLEFHNPNYLGETIAFYTKNEYYPFIRIHKKNTLEDIATLNHEVFHAYYFRNNKNEIERTYISYLKELEGDFCDFLFPIYLKEKQAPSKIIESFKNNYFANGFDQIYSIFLCDLVCKSYDQKKYIDLENIELQTLESPFAFFESDILKRILTLAPIQSMEYALAFLIQLDLAENYKKNPKMAIKHMEKIRKSKDFFKTLSTENIHFYEDHYGNIRKYIQKASH